MNNTNNKLIIKCPKCGREYLPAEIFYPNELLGKPSSIVKAEDGRIIYYNGENMQLAEDYTCDNCNTTFTATAEISFTTNVKELEDFSSDEYSSPIFANRMSLQEPEEALRPYDLFGRENK